MDFWFVSADLLGESLFAVLELLDVELENYQGVWSGEGLFDGGLVEVSDGDVRGGLEGGGWGVVRVGVGREGCWRG